MDLPPPIPPVVPSGPSAEPPVRGGLVAGGIIFMLVWLGVHMLWASLSGMANLMANDSGRASTNAQMTLILGFLAGVVVAGSAGIPGGMAFFWRGKRRLLVGLFLVLLLAGAGIQAWVFFGFFAKMS